MKLFGLTGGIGMGKSAAEQFLRQRGVPVIDTDYLARQLVQPGQTALSEIQSTFGNEIVSSEGQLRREELARIVFADAAARAKLEQILHPRIRELWRKQIQVWRNEQKPLAVVVIPLLFETAAQAEFDATVCLACLPATQRQRLQERGWDGGEIERRLSAQSPIDQKMNKADYVIWTEGSLDIMVGQLERVIGHS
jgi:dephospho-CoA kinase